MGKNKPTFISVTITILIMVLIMFVAYEVITNTAPKNIIPPEEPKAAIDNSGQIPYSPCDPTSEKCS